MLLARDSHKFLFSSRRATIEITHNNQQDDVPCASLAVLWTFFDLTTVVINKGHDNDPAFILLATIESEHHEQLNVPKFVNLN
jgi:hypothetical protein